MIAFTLRLLKRHPACDTFLPLTLTALPIISAADFLSTKDLENDDDDHDTPIYEQYNSLLHGNRSKS